MEPSRDGVGVLKVVPDGAEGETIERSSSNESMSTWTIVNKDGLNGYVMESRESTPVEEEPVSTPEIVEKLVDESTLVTQVKEAVEDNDSNVADDNDNDDSRESSPDSQSSEFARVSSSDIEVLNYQEACHHGKRHSDVEVLDYLPSDSDIHHSDQEYILSEFEEDNKLLYSICTTPDIPPVSDPGDADTESLASTTATLDETLDDRFNSLNAELPVNLDIKRDRQYIHTPNKKLNITLNLVVAVVLLFVFGFGFGHYIGWSSQDGYQNYLRALEADLVSCRSGGEAADAYEAKINELFEENVELRKAVENMGVKMPESQHEVNSQSYKEEINLLHNENSDLKQIVAKLRYVDMDRLVVENNQLREQLDQLRLSQPSSPLVETDSSKSSSQEQKTQDHTLLEKDIASTEEGNPTVLTKNPTTQDDNPAVLDQNPALTEDYTPSVQNSEENDDEKQMRNTNGYLVKENKNLDNEQIRGSSVDATEKPSYEKEQYKHYSKHYDYKEKRKRDEQEIKKQHSGKYEKNYKEEKKKEEYSHYSKNNDYNKEKKKYNERLHNRYPKDEDYKEKRKYDEQEIKKQHYKHSDEYEKKYKDERKKKEEHEYDSDSDDDNKENKYNVKKEKEDYKRYSKYDDDKEKRDSIKQENLEYQHHSDNNKEYRKYNKYDEKISSKRNYEKDKKWENENQQKYKHDKNEDKKYYKDKRWSKYQDYKQKQHHDKSDDKLDTKYAEAALRKKVEDLQKQLKEQQKQVDNIRAMMVEEKAKEETVGKSLMSVLHQMHAAVINLTNSTLFKKHSESLGENTKNVIKTLEGSLPEKAKESLQEVLTEVKNKWKGIVKFSQSKEFSGKFNNMFKSAYDSIHGFGKRFIKKAKHPAKQFVKKFSDTVEDLKSVVETQWSEVQKKFDDGPIVEEEEEVVIEEYTDSGIEPDLNDDVEVHVWTPENKTAEEWQTKVGHDKSQNRDEKSNWAFERSEHREKQRQEDTKSDWMFDRAEHREQKRQDDAKSDWMFERAKARRSNNDEDEIKFSEYDQNSKKGYKKQKRHSKYMKYELLDDHDDDDEDDDDDDEYDEDEDPHYKYTRQFQNNDHHYNRRSKRRPHHERAFRRYQHYHNRNDDDDKYKHATTFDYSSDIYFRKLQNVLNDLTAKLYR